MDDTQVQNHIEELVAEEHRLLGRSSEQGLNPADHDRLAKVRVELDRYWDLLRQRRAREEFGDDPDFASLRDERHRRGLRGLSAAGPRSARRGRSAHTAGLIRNPWWEENRTNSADGGARPSRAAAGRAGA